MKQITIKYILICHVFLSFVGTNVSCTQLSAVTAIFKRDEANHGKKHSLLSTDSLAETCVRIDIYTIRIPYNRRELLEQFWLDVEESEIPIVTRNSLYQHGLRQGMLPSKIPVSFERLLELRDIPPQRPGEKVILTGVAATNEPLHKYINVPMMRKQPVEFPICGDVMIPKLPVLAVVDGHPSGKVYENASGMILITTDEQPDGSVVVKTIPEIHYGGETRKITSQAGDWIPRVYKSKLQFEQLAVETKLLLGQWVVIGPDTRHHTGFGQDIFSQGDGNPEQILIGIRLQQTSKDGIHDRNDIAVLRISDEKSMQLEDTEEMKRESNFPPGLDDQELGKM